MIIADTRDTLESFPIDLSEDLDQFVLGNDRLRTESAYLNTTIHFCNETVLMFVDYFRQKTSIARQVRQEYSLQYLHYE